MKKISTAIDDQENLATEVNCGAGPGRSQQLVLRAR
jgi:hypothetical protein